MTTNMPLNEAAEFSILLVDDDLQIVDLLNQAARHEFPQCQFIHRATVEEAITYLDTITGWGPRLALLDIDLKTDKTGLDLLTWIRGHEKYRLLPVVVLSVIHEEETVRKAYARGANIFTNKPFSYEEWKAYVRYLRTYWFTTASTPKLWFDKPTSALTD
ncbi:response regulator [Larkinella insperata]|uniref:Response regulator n=1 Tax=Larkinella insperata TaxID=332158 RepID=A0ABW3QGY6_9BACT|nr:response regulator [Larkinella insperata]